MKAFTLIEIIIVLVILVMIAGLGIPMFQGTLENHRLRTAADQLRGELHDARIKAMEEQQVVCICFQIGTPQWTKESILDAHFTAGLSVNSSGELVDENFNPVSGRIDDSAVETLSPSIIFAAVTTVPDERSLFYTGITQDNRTGGVLDSGTDIPLDEAAENTPLFFYPDGTTSSATIVLQNASGKCIEVHLRGLTGIAQIRDSTPSNQNAL